MLKKYVFRRLAHGVLASLLCVALALQVSLPVQAAPKFAALAIDARTGAILYSDEANSQRYPASLTKMMTLYLVFQDLKSGRIKLSTRLHVSRRAASMPPSKLGLKPGSTITVEEAIKALVIKSANDAAAAVGENLGKGSESAFAARMTRVARSIGMSRTTFRNASGLPNPGQVTTAKDMATLSLRLMRDFPQYYPYFRLTTFTFRGKVIRTHNRLVGRFAGTDGIKTGYIGASGYNLVTSTRRDGRRVIGVVMGARSAGRRNAYMMTMLERALAKARNGNTIAAVAGSSKGVVNPLAQKQEIEASTQPKISEAELAPVNPEDDDDSEGMAALAEAASSEDINSPKVIQAELDLKKKKLEATVVTASTSQPKPVDPLKALDLGKSYSVQISAFNDKDAAVAAIGKVRAAAKIELKGKKAYTIAVKRNGKLEYRVVIAGLTAKSAKQSCAKVSKIGKTCAVILPQA